MKKSLLSFSWIILFLVFSIPVSCKKSAETGSKPPEQAEETPKKALAELETLEVTTIAVRSAVVISNIKNTGGSSITSRGVCWSGSPNPKIENNYIEASSVKGSGEFTSNLDALKDNSVYYVRAYATNASGTAYGNEIKFTTLKMPEPIEPIVYLDSTTFDSQEKFAEHWELLYPWGSDHNGSARMYEDQIKLELDGVLLIEAERTEIWEGYSTADPWLRIFYHSGAVHYKSHITVTEDLPEWEISGDFQAPTLVGSWPAFWITGAWTWPPESDIMEFKGNNTNWQNTVTGPDWQNTSWQTSKTVVPNAESWHNYKLLMRKVSESDVELTYFIDDKLIATHRGNFVGKPFWLIINMQMEGASGGHASGPQYAAFRARNVYVAALPNK